jgi:hypothetical protein
MRKLWLAVIPLAFIVGCGTSSGPGSVAGDEGVVASQQAAPHLDAAGRQFCQLINRAQQDLTATGGPDISAQQQDTKDAENAALGSSNTAVANWGSAADYHVGEDALSTILSGEAVCQAQGFTG